MGACTLYVTKSSPPLPILLQVIVEAPIPNQGHIKNL